MLVPSKYCIKWKLCYSHGSLLLLSLALERWLRFFSVGGTGGTSQGVPSITREVCVQ